VIWVEMFRTIQKRLAIFVARKVRLISWAIMFVRIVRSWMRKKLKELDMDRKQLIKELERFVILGDICYKHQLGFIADFIISYTEELRKENEELKGVIQSTDNLIAENTRLTNITVVFSKEIGRLKALVDEVEKILNKGNNIQMGHLLPEDAVDEALAKIAEYKTNK